MKNDEGRSAPHLLAQGAVPNFGAAVPVPFEKLDTEAEYYGVHVATVGEDGDVIAAFTHDRRRAIAAVNRLVRESWQVKLLRLDIREVCLPGERVRAEQWWVALDNCGCGDVCPHEKDEDGWSDCDCKSYGLPPCVEAEMVWMARLVPEGTAGAFPALEFEVSY